ncbi:MAG: hypothetical protein ABIX12_05045 [Rubrivivax sp.]
MIFDVSVALSWVLFLAVFPMAFFWLRRAWRILFRGDFSEVALKGGMPPPDPARWAPYTAIVNLVAGGSAVAVILMVVLFGAPYGSWTAVAGTTIWCKFFADFALGRHAHGFGTKAKPKAKATTPGR